MTFAMKIPEDTSYYENLQKERRTLSGLEHPNVIRIVPCKTEDCKIDGYSPHIVMEEAEYGSLDILLTNWAGKLPEEICRTFFLSII